MRNGSVSRAEMVVVTLKGHVLDAASFRVRDEAEAYKGNVRRWAVEKGVVVRLWSVRGSPAGVTLPPPPPPTLARAC